MEKEIIQALEDVGYAGTLLDSEKLKKALQGGAHSTEFTNLISWLTDQIGYFAKIDESVHPTSSPEDASSFLLEISTFLQESGCTNKKFTTGNVNQRFATIEDRTNLIDFLISELMACKILESSKPENDKNMEITISESMTAKNMREMLTALRFQKPPDNITPDLLFKKLHAKVSEVVRQIPKELLGKPLFFGELSNVQWDKLDKLQGDFNEEYKIRREMLLTRLDVTVTSFLWSERIKPKENQLNKCYHVKRDAMKCEPDVTLAHLLAARDDLAIIEKTSSASVRKNTKSAINKVIIGAVPDRGGRPCEQEPPPPEMPPWQKDRVPLPQRGGFSAGGGGGRGGSGGGVAGGGSGNSRGRGGGGRGGRGEYQNSGSGGGYRDNKFASSNFGQNSDNSQRLNFSFGNQVGGYNYCNQSAGYSGNANTSNYSGQSSSYSGQSSGYSGQQSYSNLSTGSGNQSGYSNQNTGYKNQGSNYNQGNQGYNQGSQGGYDKTSGGGDYNRGGQNKGGRVQGGWNQGNDSGSYYNQSSYNNRNQGYQGGRRNY